MCRPDTTIARQDFVALATERGWTPEEIQKALNWMADRRSKRIAEEQAAYEAEQNRAALEKLETEVAALKAKIGGAS